MYSIAEPSCCHRLGRLANHSKRQTAHPRIIDVDGLPHLCLVASRDLEPGDQVLYDYGVILPFCDLIICFFPLSNSKSINIYVIFLV